MKPISEAAKAWDAQRAEGPMGKCALAFRLVMHANECLPRRRTNWKWGFCQHCTTTKNEWVRYGNQVQNTIRKMDRAQVTRELERVP